MLTGSRINILLSCCFILTLTLTSTFATAQKRSIVHFPDVTKAIQVSQNGKEHFFASYYGINSFSKNQRFITVLETDVRNKIPEAKDTATLGLIDLKTNEFIPVTKTTAWNFQQGCMAHWLATNPDSLIIYNDYRKGKFVSIILNVLLGKEIKEIPYPIAAVSPNGKEAISINFARLRITRTDYGYDGPGQDAQPGVQFPGNDGLFLIDLQTGNAELIVSYEQLKSSVPPINDRSGMEYVGHVLFSRAGSKIFFLARAIPDWNTTSFTVNKDGSNLQRSFPDGWGGSHFDWLTDNDLMITAMYEAKIYGHILYTAGQKNYKRLGHGLLDYDGHGTFSPNGNWMVTDTYPGTGLREQKIYLMDMRTEAVLPLGRYPQPAEFTGGWRCDIHCRWSPNGDMIGFNSTHTGSRQVYILKLKYK
jgi:Tol biopolymer transport system component